jgi:tRNA pseudouridine38-40 synthase
MKKKYKISISYDGTLYCGWQTQKNSPSIQDTIQKALKTLLKEKIILTASGRTDAGVHANEQIAHFSTNKTLPPSKTLLSLNGILPKDIRITSLKKASASFHARYHVKSKIYKYFINTNTFQDPFKIKYSYHFTKKLDLNLLKKAALQFIGTHDFTSFANVNSSVKNKIRTIKKLKISNKNNILTLEFEADGFLYKMVRNIVGTLLDVATKKIEISEIKKIFKAKDRKKAKRAAPPHALFLIKVKYHSKTSLLKSSSKDSKCKAPFNKRASN